MRYEDLLFHVSLDVLEKLEKRVKELLLAGDNQYEAEEKVLNEYLKRGKNEDDE